ncbi:MULTISPECIES: thioredoxin family protein [Prochlorococcus]|uniref:thioredoxin family protein n=1 Tax=Prochlorococcus TaxID=1218 RepID=UPI000533AE95|nr:MULTISPECIES: thioredoxin family protein [Prochlorococcus]KGG13081.1 Alkyl hydroperoxide reductase and/or thiol-specific antioxidant family (AhpC/TSA) protein [Prochlorococcus sp. MIT 0601]
MVKALSTMLPLGTELPFFELPVISGTGLRDEVHHGKIALLKTSTFHEKPLLIMILCAHCPFVKHVETQLTKLDQDYLDKVDFLAVASNSLITHPQDSPDNLRSQSLQAGWRFPYVLDSDQSFAKAIRAACTPDFFLFSPNVNGVQELRYRGQLDDSRPGNKVPLDGRDLRLALNSVLKNEKVFSEQKPSIGCNIKWDPNNEPSWFGSIDG